MGDILKPTIAIPCKYQYNAHKPTIFKLSIYTPYVCIGAYLNPLI